MSDFKWTDELVLMAIDLAHHNGYHKLKQRVTELFDEIKKQAQQGGGYKFASWITDHVKPKSGFINHIVDAVTEREKVYQKLQSSHTAELEKEEILAKHFGDPEFESSDYELKAMDEYAEQEALGFIHFTEFKMDDDDWLDDKGELKSMQEVYQMYLKSKLK
jgi:hypothetical protein